MYGGTGGGMNPGQHYDRFIYAAMLSRARIEQAWSGSAEDPSAAPAEMPLAEEPAAFDPEMLKNLAARAESGEIPEAAPPLPSTSCFSAAAIEAAKPLLQPMAPLRGGPSTEAVNAVPAAFRPKKATPQTAVDEKNSVVPLAFLRMRQASQPAAPAAPPPPPADTMPAASSTAVNAGSQPYDPTSPPVLQDAAQSTGEKKEPLSGADLEQFKKDFEEKMKNAQKAQADAGADGSSGQPQAGQWSVLGETSAGPAGNDIGQKVDVAAEANRKDAVAAAVKDIVSAKMDQARLAVESTRAFHAVAPEPKPVDPTREDRKKAKWDSEVARMQERGLPLPLETPSGAPPGAPPGDMIATANVPTLRELSTLARGDTHPDAPMLGELRAPAGPADDPKNASSGKSGAALAREQKARAAAPRQRSRSRSRRRRRRSPSTSPETKNKRLFTDKPSFRLTGSSFSSASTKPAETEKKRKRGGFDAPDLSAQSDVPDWLKDMGAPATTPAPTVMGKKYLHMPRIMVEVLTHNGGEALRACTTKSGAQIRVETMIEEPIGIVSVNGAVGVGEMCIREVLANKGLDLPPQDGLVMPFVAPTPATGGGGNEHGDVQIPSELVRHFVGHRGANMKAITQQLGHAVSIQILPSVLPGGFQRIQITGSNRAKARQMVVQHIDELKRQKLTLWGDTHKGQSQTPLPPPPPPAEGGMRI